MNSVLFKKPCGLFVTLSVSHFLLFRGAHYPGCEFISLIKMLRFIKYVLAALSETVMYIVRLCKWYLSYHVYIFYNFSFNGILLKFLSEYMPVGH